MQALMLPVSGSVLLIQVVQSYHTTPGVSPRQAGACDAVPRWDRRRRETFLSTILLAGEDEQESINQQKLTASRLLVGPIVEIGLNFYLRRLLRQIACCWEMSAMHHGGDLQRLN